MRLSDAGLRRSKTKLIYPNHRLPPWPTEVAPRDRSNRLLGVLHGACINVTTPSSRGFDGDTSTPYSKRRSAGANAAHANVSLYAIFVGATVKSVSIFGGVSGPSQHTSASGGPFTSTLQLVKGEPSLDTIVPRTRKPPSHATVIKEAASKSENLRKALLTMRLSDAGMRRRQTKLIYPNHRLPPWLTEDATPRSLEPIVRRLTGTVR
jgi:hypothetical protein